MNYFSYHIKTQAFTLFLLLVAPFLSLFGRPNPKLFEGERFPQCYNIVLINKYKKNNFCIHVIPKNGSMTLRNQLNTKDVVSFDSVKDRLDEYTNLITVRNPLYRPASIYVEVLRLRSQAPEITKQMGFYKIKQDPIASFKLFLHEIDNNFYNAPINHQHLTMEKKNLTLQDMDFVFLFENLDKDIQTFCAHHNIQNREKHLNSSPDNIRELLINLINTDPEVKQQIYKLWEKDFEFYEEAKKRRQDILKSWNT